MSDFRSGDADGLTEAGMRRMIDWLHNIKAGEVAGKNDVVMCDLLAYEIERLEKDNKRMRDSFWNTEVSQLRERIEELKEELEATQIEDHYGVGAHIITRAQIRAAVSMGDQIVDESLRSAWWAALVTLGIVRCGCRVIGDSSIINEDGDPCPLCNGEGFKVKGSQP